MVIMIDGNAGNKKNTLDFHGFGMEFAQTVSARPSNLRVTTGQVKRSPPEITQIPVDIY